jgi:hypothetical protein
MIISRNADAAMGLEWVTSTPKRTSQVDDICGDSA